MVDLSFNLNTVLLFIFIIGLGWGHILIRVIIQSRIIVFGRFRGLKRQFDLDYLDIILFVI